MVHSKYSISMVMGTLAVPRVMAWPYSIRKKKCKSHTHPMHERPEGVLWRGEQFNGEQHSQSVGGFWRVTQVTGRRAGLRATAWLIRGEKRVAVAGCSCQSMEKATMYVCTCSPLTTLCVCACVVASLGDVVRQSTRSAIGGLLG